jgi:hypothetical protein
MGLDFMNFGRLIYIGKELICLRELGDNIEGVQSNSTSNKSYLVFITYTGNANDRVLVVLLSDRREMLPE